MQDALKLHVCHKASQNKEQLKNTYLRILQQHHKELRVFVCLSICLPSVKARLFIYFKVYFFLEFNQG